MNIPFVDSNANNVFGRIGSRSMAKFKCHSLWIMLCETVEQTFFNQFRGMLLEADMKWNLYLIWTLSTRIVVVHGLCIKWWRDEKSRRRLRFPSLSSRFGMDRPKKRMNSNRFFHNIYAYQQDKYQPQMIGFLLFWSRTRTKAFRLLNPLNKPCTVIDCNSNCKFTTKKIS